MHSRENRLATHACCPLHSNCRAGLGLGGVLIVASAVVGSLGLCSWAGMRSTLIIMEVIPFLVLAGGFISFVLFGCLFCSSKLGVVGPLGGLMCPPSVACLASSVRQLKLVC